MATDDPDALVLFEDVNVIKSTASALHCRVGERKVWLPRWHISGKLWCAGDRGKLFIRRWVARDRNLIDAHGAAIHAPVPLLSHLPVVLRLVRPRNVAHAKQGRPDRWGAS